jgi:hypothetical protein
LNRFKPLPHPEERREAARLEGWATGKVLVPTLRDASLRDAPQGEVIGAVHSLLFWLHSFRVRLLGNSTMSVGIIPLILQSDLRQST